MVSTAAGPFQTPRDGTRLHRPEITGDAHDYMGLLRDFLQIWHLNIHQDNVKFRAADGIDGLGFFSLFIRHPCGTPALRPSGRPGRGLPQKLRRLANRRSNIGGSTI